MQQEPPSTPLAALNRAIEAVDTQSEFARRLGVTQPSVWAWVHKAQRIPAEYVLKAEAETGVSRHDLRPDIYPRDENESAAA